jgi:integrase/recombinase XerD
VKQGVKMLESQEPITVQAAIEEYRYAILQLSEQTQTWYMARLVRFASWCAEQEIGFQQLKPTTIAKYLHGLSSNKSTKTGKLLSTYTVHGHARTIRTFLNWCAKEPQEYLPSKISANIAMPRIKKKIIEIFSDLQIKAFFVAAGQQTTKPIAIRDKAILAVLLDTGIRASELCELKLSDVHLTPYQGHIKVCGKGDKEREVGLGAKTRHYLQTWIKHYRRASTEEEHAFLGHKGLPLTVNGLNQMIRRLARRAKITGVRCSPHTFRHTFAVRFLQMDGDLFVLSRLLGHESVQITTGVYLQALKSDQARKMGKSVLDGLF